MGFSSSISNLKNQITAIANAIRNYNGTSTKYKLSEMADAITTVYNKGVVDGSKSPYLLKVTATCNQEYGTYNWSGNFTVSDALTGTTIFSGSRGTYHFTYNSCSYTVTCTGDTVYGAYTPWIKVIMTDTTHGVSVCKTSGTTTRVIWNGSSYQSI